MNNKMAMDRRGFAEGINIILYKF